MTREDTVNTARTMCAFIGLFKAESERPLSPPELLRYRDARGALSVIDGDVVLEILCSHAALFRKKLR